MDTRKHKYGRGQHLVDAGRHFATGNGWMAALLARQANAILDRIDAGLEMGSIETQLPDGKIRLVGGRGDGPHAVVNLHSYMPLVRLWASGSVGGYIAWTKGEWTSPDEVAFFTLLMRNRVTLGNTGRAHGGWRFINRLMHAMRRNTPKGARRNVAAHYDLGNDFYAHWLDGTMTYSSAMFADETRSEALEAAQERKMRLLLDRLSLKPGDHLLEIGCGWGALSEMAARDYGVRATALTLSAEQKVYAAARMREAGVADQVTILLQDYRYISGQFDAVASVEMVEAVGQAYWPTYLDTISRVLKPGGKAAIQFISIAEDAFEGYSRNADFIQTYIFPGGILLSENRFSALAKARGLSWQDRHGFGIDYAETLKRWRLRFESKVDEGLVGEGFDARFVDLWRYYLIYCEGGFRGQGIDVAQVTMTKCL